MIKEFENFFVLISITIELIRCIIRKSEIKKTNKISAPPELLNNVRDEKKTYPTKINRLIKIGFKCCFKFLNITANEPSICEERERN